MNWGRVGSYWALHEGHSNHTMILVYKPNEELGLWEVSWFDLPDNPEHISMTEKGEEELREYLKMKYLLLREG